MVAEPHENSTTLAATTMRLAFIFSTHLSLCLPDGKHPDQVFCLVVNVYVQAPTTFPCDMNDGIGKAEFLSCSP